MPLFRGKRVKIKQKLDNANMVQTKNSSIVSETLASQKSHDNCSNQQFESNSKLSNDQDQRIKPGQSIRRDKEHYRISLLLLSRQFLLFMLQLQTFYPLHHLSVMIFPKG